MAFTGLKITDAGTLAAAKTAANKPLHFTRMAVGDGVLGLGSVIAQTALISEKTSIPIDAVRISGNKASVIGLFSNATLVTGFYFREMGVYCKDPDTLQEVLYAADNCREEGEYIPDKTSQYKISSYLRMRLGFSSTPNITFDASGNPIYVLYEDFNEHVQDYTARVTLLEAGLTELQTSDAAQDTQLSAHQTAIEGLQTAVEGVHTHANKGALDGITAAKVAEWDGKAEVSAVQTAQNAANAAQSTANAALPKAGGTMTGQLTAQSNTAYTTRQARNILMFTSGASLTGSQSGDVVHEYK